ncbi:MAG: DUF5693 family protein [Bacillota bacterium]
MARRTAWAGWALCLLAVLGLAGLSGHLFRAPGGVDLMVDLGQVMDLAAREGMSGEAVLVQFRQAGATALAVPERNLRRLAATGDVALSAGSAQVSVRPLNPAAAVWLPDSLTEAFGAAAVRAAGGRFEVRGGSELVLEVPLGLYPSDLDLAARAGLRSVPVLANRRDMTGVELARLLAPAREAGARGVVFLAPAPTAARLRRMALLPQWGALPSPRPVSPLVTRARWELAGYPGNLTESALAVQAAGLTHHQFPLFDQPGLADYFGVLGAGIKTMLAGPTLSPDMVAATVRQRGMEVVYFETERPADAPFVTASQALDSVRRTATALVGVGRPPGTPARQAPAPGWLPAVTAAAVLAGGWIAPPLLAAGLGAVAGSVLTVVAPQPGRQRVAWAALTAFPALAGWAALQTGEARRALLSAAIAVGGALAVTAALAHPGFLAEVWAPPAPWSARGLGAGMALLLWVRPGFGQLACWLTRRLTYGELLLAVSGSAYLAWFLTGAPGPAAIGFAALTYLSGIPADRRSPGLLAVAATGPAAVCAAGLFPFAPVSMLVMALAEAVVGVGIGTALRWQRQCRR